MRNRAWTIIVGWGDSSRPRQLRFTKRQLFSLLTVLSVGFLLLTGLLLRSLGNRGDLAAFTLLQDNKQALLSELEDLSLEIDSLREVMAGLVHLDRGVRVVAGLSVADTYIVGIGGSTEIQLSPPSVPFGEEEDQGLEVAFGDLERGVDFAEESLKEVLKTLTIQEDLLAHTPSILPASGRITSGFGMRYNPWSKRREFHKGLDIANRPGTPIFAPADGVVTYRGWKKGFGKFLSVDHGYGYRTRYGHLKRILVKVGDRVRRGQIIAQLGNTGRSTGPHLHYEVLVRGRHVNPKNYIAWEFVRY